MWEVFEKLLKERGLRQYDISKALNISPSLFSDWKKGRYQPKQDKLQAIADYLDVSLKYLMTGQADLPEDAPEYLFDEEAREAAEFLHKNPQYKVLFSATRNVRPEDIEFVKQFLDRL